MTSIALALSLTSAAPGAAASAGTLDDTPAAVVPTDYDMSALERSQNAEPATTPALAMPPLATAPQPATDGEDEASASASVFKRWWFWTAIGITVVGAIIAGVALQPRDPGCPRDAVCL